MRDVRRGWRNRLLWLSSAHGGHLQLVFFATMIMIVSLLMTTSRSGIACFFVAISLAGVFAVGQQRSWKARVVLVAALAALAVVPLAWSRVDVIGRMATVGTRRRVARAQAGDLARRDRDRARLSADRHRAQHVRHRHREVPDRPVRHACARGAQRLPADCGGGRPAARRPAPSRPCCSSSAPCGAGSVSTTTTACRTGSGSAPRPACVAIALQSAVEFSLQMPGNAVLFVVLCAAALHRAPYIRIPGRPLRRA